MKSFYFFGGGKKGKKSLFSLILRGGNDWGKTEEGEPSSFWGGGKEERKGGNFDLRAGRRKWRRGGRGSSRLLFVLGSRGKKKKRGEGRLPLRLRTFLTIGGKGGGIFSTTTFCEKRDDSREARGKGEKRPSILFLLPEKRKRAATFSEGKGKSGIRKGKENSSLPERRKNRRERREMLFPTRKRRGHCLS